ncbi:MliC family protein [Cucumibacter marinus]|uniref:MliC family protein n=1 Tax=Cucumibacter marinus TaxID=1121252 RepID=UPI00041D7DAF|nr:MliC family protein [Cucumibacter marinus]
MLKRALALVLGLAAITAFAASGQAQADVPEIQQYSYSCEDGTVMPATYINVPDGDSYAVIQADGRQIAMQAGPTGSGVRYVGLGDQHGYVWHTKGMSGILYFDNGDSLRDILTGCRGELVTDGSE